MPSFSKPCGTLLIRSTIRPVNGSVNILIPSTLRSSKSIRSCVAGEIQSTTRPGELRPRRDDTHAQKINNGHWCDLSAAVGVGLGSGFRAGISCPLSEAALSAAGSVHPYSDALLLRITSYSDIPKNLCDCLGMGNPAGVRRDVAALEQRRREAAELLRQGVHHPEVARRVGAHRQSVSRWAEQLKEG